MKWHATFVKVFITQSAATSRIPNLKPYHVRDIATWFCPTCLAMKPMEKIKMILPMQKKIEELAKAVEDLKQNTKKNETLDSDSILHEWEERKEKELNLIIVGLPEDVENIPKMEDPIEKELGCNAKGNVENVWKIRSKKTSQNVHLTGVRLKNKDLRNSILQNAKKLLQSANPEYKKMCINPDYTFSQRNKMKELREELKTRRDNGEDLVIRNFRLVPPPKRK